VTPRELLQKLPEHTLQIVKVARVSTNSNLYLVGGTLRDLFLNVPIQDNDLDFVVEANAAEFASHLQNNLGGTLSSHPEFGTFKVLTDNFTLDIITSRAETYSHSGALPKVKFSTISDDLARRDFSINAIALQLTPELKLLDPHHGQRDLENKTLRILHPSSFLDDPTRMLRGARLAGRLGLSWEDNTWGKITEALSSEAINNISKDRLKAELELALTERKVSPVLEQFAACEALEICFGLSLNVPVIQSLDSQRKSTFIPFESYLFALFLELDKTTLEAFLQRFHYPLRYLESIQRIQSALSGPISSELYIHLSQAEIGVIKASNSDLEKRLLELEEVFRQRRLMGQDVLNLGLLPGPRVGKILAEVAHARDKGQVSGFEQELELARQLVMLSKIKS
jgi:tRNA nucleotidyltransferase (CCA-adding enzyme)